MNVPNRPPFELPPSRGRIARAVDEEIRAHLEERAAELAAAGLSPAAARERALREFGDVPSALAEIRRIDERAARRSRLAEAADALGQELARTVRGLARRPAFALVASGTLALGIGANVAVYGLVDRLLLGPPAHVEEPAAVVRLGFEEATPERGRMQWGRAPWAAYEALGATRPPFAALAAYATSRVGAAIAVDAEARDVGVAAVTPGYFATLGTRPLRGRFLGAADSAAAVAGGRAVVIGHALWRGAFGGSESALGRDLLLDGVPYRVVGVAPRGFVGPGDMMEVADVWVPLEAAPGMPDGWRARAGMRAVAVVARLRPDVPAPRAAAEATRRYRAALAGTADADSSAVVLLASLASAREAQSGHLAPEARVALWLQGVALLVLAIALANVANLFLLRAVERRREAAVRAALGAGRLRLSAQLALEGLVLAALGGALALALVRWAAPPVWALVLPPGTDAGWLAARLARPTAAIAAAAALALALLALVARRGGALAQVLRDGARGATGRGSAGRDALAVLQLAVTVTLLVGAGLFLRSLLHAGALDLGFEPDRVVGARVATPALAERAAERVRALPGVEELAVSQSAPYRPSMGAPFSLPGREQLPGVGPQGAVYPTFFAVSPEFFRVMGLRVLRGRGLAASDVRGAPRVMVVDATMARLFWPGADALGQCVRVGADTMPCTTVVGVVEDSRRGIDERQHSLRYYLPLPQTPVPDAERWLFARTRGDPTALVGPVRAAVAGVSPPGRAVEVLPMRRLLDWQMRPWRLGSAVLVAFGALSTVIAAVGLYGIIAFGVARREREIGVRLALGAPRAAVVRGVAREAWGRAALAVALGGVAALLVGRRLRELLFRTSETDAVVYAVVAAVVLVTAAVASAVPAWRAARVDPARSLRAD